MHADKIRLLTVSVFALISSAIAFVPSFAATQPADVVSLVGDSTHWSAQKWSPTEEALFGGMPVYRGKHKDLLILRYSFYTVNYDTEQLAPLWVAHINRGHAIESALIRTEMQDQKWKRLTSFYPDTNLIAFSNEHHRPYVVDDSFTNCNPTRDLPGQEGSMTHITRGHNASNEEMKLSGDPEEGNVSQHESFSLANVSPQTQGHNAPLWAGLEKDCLRWAAKVDRVAIITGPVFRPDPSLPLPVKKIIFTNGKKGPLIPIPTHFYKIIIGKIDGKFAAVGFLVPHLSSLKKDDYKKYVVPIAEIEKATDLTFFPSANLPPAKDLIDHRWLDMLKIKAPE